MKLVSELAVHKPVHRHHQPPSRDQLRRRPRGLATVVKRNARVHSVCVRCSTQFGIDAVPYVICRGFSKEETEIS